MNCGWLQYSHLSVTKRGSDSNRFSKAITEVDLDVVRSDVHQFP